MHGWKDVIRYGLGLALLVVVSTPIAATTLIRAGLEDLVATNATIVVGEVLDAHSYWNADGNFILTDVSVEAVEIIKGTPAESDLKVTVMGGTVGETTTLILGGPVLEPGRSYLLFLNREDLPGAPRSMAIRDLSQGAFDIDLGEDGELVAISQARDEALLPDKHGNAVVLGGAEGLPLDSLLRTLRETVAHATTDEEESR